MSSRGKEEQANTPSRGSSSEPSCCTVLLRNAPLQASEEEIGSFASQFGRVLTVAQRHGAISSTALIEFAEPRGAEAMVAELSNAPTRLYANTVYAAFASKDDITSQNKCAKDTAICSPKPTLYIKMKNALSYVTPKNLYEAFSQYGLVKKALIFQKKELQAFVEMGSVREAITAKENLNGKNLFATHCNMSITYGFSDTLDLKTQSSNAADFTITGMRPLPVGRHPNVVFVHGFEPADFTCDRLYNLFSIYGDVRRIKIFFSSPDNAIIQFSSHDGVVLAINMLNNVNYHGRVISVRLTKGGEVQASREPSEFTKDYTSDKPPACLPLCYTPPSRSLFMSNLAWDESEKRLYKLLSTFGELRLVKMLATMPKSAVVEYKAKDAAVSALLALNNGPIGKSSTCPMYPFYLTGVVVRGFRRGTTMGYPTANLESAVLSQAALERFEMGSYYGVAALYGGNKAYRVAVSIGSNPSFGNERRTVEVHFLHRFDELFYGARINVIILGFIRRMEKFASLDALKRAIAADSKVALDALDDDALDAYLSHPFFLGEHR